MSSKGTKTKIILNLLLLIVIFAIIYYLINQSFADIFAELLSTSVVVLAAAVILGTVYQIAEGRSIKEIAEPFAPNFTTKDGFLKDIPILRVAPERTDTGVMWRMFTRDEGEPLQ